MSFKHMYCHYLFLDPRLTTRYSNMDFHIIDVLELNMFAFTLDDAWCV